MNKIKNASSRTFLSSDIRQLQSQGRDSALIVRHLAMFRKGPYYLKLKRPCDVHDGIMECTAGQKKQWVSFYDQEAPNYTVMKFVPASGAASRMFAAWYAAATNGHFGSVKSNQLFLRDLRTMPFFDMIDGDTDGRRLLMEKNIGGLLRFILSPDGLDLGGMPKAFIPFHVYPSGETRNSLQEHICEASHYIRGSSDICCMHVTVPSGCRKQTRIYLKKILPAYEDRFSVRYDIDFSIQEHGTDTIAVDVNNQPLRDERGKIIFRPGGHGALLKNLNDLDADFVFIRNIDNVAPENYWGVIIPYRKMMGGIAIKTQQEIFRAIGLLKYSEASSFEIKAIVAFCRNNLNMCFPRDFSRQSREDKIKYLLLKLNRPLRVCAMVRNEKEPGGGPFWVQEDDGMSTLQIVESVHVDTRNAGQAAIWSNSKYFNPVDMVCALRNYRGKKFNLFNYVNKKTYIISRKNEKGKEIKALELPGLWNGSMAYWNTIFVKLPLIVFNPVKTVYDLLRSEHLISREKDLANIR